MKRKNTLKLIGKNIKRHRILSDLTQEGLADMMDLSRVSIVNIEYGRQSIPIYRIPLICEILSIKPNELFK